MLVSLGRRRPATDLVATLLECHERIRSFSALAVRLGDRPELPAEQIDDACARIARYFVDALPLHVQDEEASIGPRLVGRAQALDDALAEMHVQHEAHEPLLRRLVELCARMRAAPDDAVRSAFREVTYHLDQELGRHLELEETLLFPALRTELSGDEEAAIVAELRARRQVR